MGIGISVLLLAAGAVLTWAVDFNADGWNPHVVGIVLLVVGAIGLVWALAVSSAMPWHRDDVIRGR